MNTKFLVAGAIAASMLVVVPALAMGGDNQDMGEHMTGMMGEHSTSTSATLLSTQVLSCVGAAVNTRESAIGSAVSTHNSAVQAAYSARATALASAYSTGGTASQVRAAVKAAWSAFTKAVRTANTAWKTSRNSAWSTYRTAVKACKAPGNITDSGNSGSEMSGN
jgi:hypothetical protein